MLSVGSYVWEGVWYESRLRANSLSLAEVDDDKLQRLTLIGQALTEFQKKTTSKPLEVDVMGLPDLTLYGQVTTVKCPFTFQRYLLSTQMSPSSVPSGTYLRCLLCLDQSHRFLIYSDYILLQFLIQPPTEDMKNLVHFEDTIRRKLYRDLKHLKVNLTEQSSALLDKKRLGQLEGLMNVYKNTDESITLERFFKKTRHE